MTLAYRLGAWISALRIVDVPADLRDKAKDHLLDTVGAGIVGNGRAPVRVAADVFRAPGGVPVLVDAAPRSLVDAARVNAVAAHAAEIDDTEGCDHTGAVVVPVLLALAHEGFFDSGDDLLAAMIAGYEVGRRVQTALGGYDAHNAVGWHSTATCGVFAAAAAAARALSLDASRSAAALGIAASSSAGGWAFAADGSMTKQLHVANAAGNGLEAALLARAGASGPTAVFEDVWGGFFRTHGDERAQPDALVRDLGVRWHVAHSAIKMYAACRSAHPALDAVVDALERGDVVADEVTSVRLELSPFLRAMVCPASPGTVEAARMSLPLSIAFLLRGETLVPNAYARFADADVVGMLARFEIAENDELATPDTIRVVLRTASGCHTLERDQARGSEHEPFTAEAVREKFRTLTDPIVGATRADALIAWVDALGPGPVVPLPPIWRGAP